MIINDPATPAEVAAAFRRYGTALVSDGAAANTGFHRDGADRVGRQSRSWVRMPEGWRVVSAHVSLVD